ncbi:hypothetical protein TNCV_2471961 [Trichonephila clavipes]|nr:hypothetical protein TNCV_2471961 [Trichonephila clavipes]
MGDVFKTTSVCTNSSMTFAAVWTLRSKTMASATLEAVSQIGAFKGEHTFAADIRHRHTGPSPSMMVWNDIEYTSRSPLVCTGDSTLNSSRYISRLLRPVSLPFIQALRNLTFRQDRMLPVFYGPFLIRKIFGC